MKFVKSIYNKVAYAGTALALAAGLVFGGHYLWNNPHIVTGKKTTKTYLAEKLSELEGKGLDYIVPDTVVKAAIMSFLDKKSGYTPTTTQSALCAARRTTIDHLLKPGFENDAIYREAAYFSWSRSDPCYLKDTGLNEEDVKDMPEIYKQVLDIGKSAVSDPVALMMFMHAKESVIRDVINEYAQRPGGKERLQEVSGYLDNVTKAVEVSKEENFRFICNAYLEIRTKSNATWKQEKASRTKMNALEEKLIEKLPEGELKQQIKARSGWHYYPNQKQAISALRPQDPEMHKIYLEYRQAEEEWHKLGVESCKQFDMMRRYEEALAKFTPDYHASMFAFRRLMDGGTDALKGLEDALGFARKIIVEYK